MFMISINQKSPFRKETEEVSRTFLTNDTIYLLAHVDSPSEEMKNAFQWQDHFFGLGNNRGHAMIYERFGDRMSEFSIHLLLERSQEIRNSFLRDPNEEGGYIFISVLIDVKTNIVVGLRFFSLSKVFNYRLSQIFFKQIQIGKIKPPLLLKRFEEIWNNLPHTEKCGTK